ncbi:hypothetical protein Pan97_31970 [Bremerella volcania]|uniref:Uncharacterized protein n=1 Tax=Bremerella volcania TaxID=2527984 RepID=A0A518CAA3_9BACT|nr:hypothetical protein [Bremerella volcania]QDU76152.1 hypothetical protein Pan97_31970 [Bremerella volcania]
MTFLSRHPSAAIAASVLILASPGCGFTPAATAPEPAHQTQATAPSMEHLASAEAATSAVAPTAKPSPVTSPPESNQTYRNPFRPPTVKARTLTPEQAESANIRLLGIAKRDSQHIALLETAGDFHKAVVGDFIDQWEVLSVTESEATLRRGLEQISLRIR